MPIFAHIIPYNGYNIVRSNVTLSIIVKISINNTIKIEGSVLMQIKDFDLETRNKIYCVTKKVLRKYQKGVSSGKLTAEKFIDNIIEEGSISKIINENLLSSQNFKHSYIDYINILMNNQNDNIQNHKKNRNSQHEEIDDVKKRVKFKHLLDSSGYALNIPEIYLTSSDIDCLSKFILTGSIDLGDEKFYKYVHKI